MTVIPPKVFEISYVSIVTRQEPAGEPSASQIKFAQRVLAACPTAPTYGRLDLVRDNHRNLAVMELKLIEPELWLRNHPPAATVFADAIARIVLA